MVQVNFVKRTSENCRRGSNGYTHAREGKMYRETKKQATAGYTGDENEEGKGHWAERKYETFTVSESFPLSVSQKIGASATNRWW